MLLFMPPTPIYLPLSRLATPFRRPSLKMSTAPPTIASALAGVQSRLSAAAAAANRSPPRLVAVSKMKPVSAAREAYDAGARHFGENYVQELVAKAPELPSDARWHFIGALQTNKAKALVGVEGLWCVETVDRAKAARALEKAAEGRTERLRVMVQVNTSGEENKAGCGVGEAVDVARCVKEECGRLELVGLMTIGAAGDGDCFRVLREVRDGVEKELGLEGLELSMGMSGDFEEAIAAGSDSVRVGSTIFGARDYGTK